MPEGQPAEYTNTITKIDKENLKVTVGDLVVRCSSKMLEHAQRYGVGTRVKVSFKNRTLQSIVLQDQRHL